MNRRIVTLGLIQMSMADDAGKNLEKAELMIRDAAEKGANVVVLPELFLGPYFCRIRHDETAFARAEAIPGPTTAKLSALAKELKIVLVGGSIYEQTKDKRYNTACVFNPDGSLVGTYRKTHIPHDPGFWEQDYFAAGDTGFRVHDTAFGKIAVMICYDQWFPEAARLAAMAGAEILIYPTAIGNPDLPNVVPNGMPEDWEPMWRAAQVGHSASNNVFVATVNRVGTEHETAFFGGSFVADPSATVIAQGGHREEILLAKCDLDLVKEMQECWRFFLERRPDAYGGLTKS